MTILSSRLAVLAAIAVSASSLAAQDQLVLQAQKKIESVETGLKKLADGDIPAANRLLADLQWATKHWFAENGPMEGFCVHAGNAPLVSPSW